MELIKNAHALYRDNGPLTLELSYVILSKLYSLNLSRYYLRHCRPRLVTRRSFLSFILPCQCDAHFYRLVCCNFPETVSGFNITWEKKILYQTSLGITVLLDHAYKTYVIFHAKTCALIGQLTMLWHLNFFPANGGEKATLKIYPRAQEITFRPRLHGSEQIFVTDKNLHGCSLRLHGTGGTVRIFERLSVQVWDLNFFRSRTCTFSRSNIFSVPPVPCKRKVEPDPCKGRSRWTGTSCIVLKVPLCNLLTSMCDFVPWYRIVQRAY